MTCCPPQIFRPSYGTVKAIVVECVKNAQRLASMAWKGTSMVNVQELFLNLDLPFSDKLAYFIKRKILAKTFTNSLTKIIYRKVTSSNTSRLEAHAGFFRLLMKGIFDPYVL